MKKFIIFSILFAGITAMASSAFSGQAKWIWSDKKFRHKTSAFFRKSFVLEDTVKSAELLICSDDSCRMIAVNGKPAKRISDPVQKGAPIRVRRYEVKSLLTKGNNLLALEIFNNISFAGFIMKLEIVLNNNKKITILSDKNFKVSSTAGNDFIAPSYDDSSWQQAVVIGDASCPYWSKITRAEDFFFTEEEKALKQELQKNSQEYIKKINYSIPGDGFGKSKWIWYPEISIAVAKTPRFFLRGLNSLRCPVQPGFWSWRMTVAKFG